MCVIKCFNIKEGYLDELTPKMEPSQNCPDILLLLLRSQSHAQTSSPVLTRKSAVRQRDAVGPQSFSFRSTGFGQVSCLRLLCDEQECVQVSRYNMAEIMM